MQPNSEARHILVVRSGRSAGEKLLLREGDRHTVGRSHPADFQVPYDELLSAVHFEIAKKEGVTITDRASRRGTAMNGIPLKEPTAVSDGAIISAGATAFSFHRELSSRPRATPEPACVQRARALAASLRPRRMFAVLDAARNSRVLELLFESIDAMQSLYEGFEADAMAQAAPYLVELSPDSKLLDQLLMEGEGDSWGVFIESSQSFRELRRHLRRLLMVELAGTAKPVYFRAYDPRVLERIWPLLTVSQRATLLGDSPAWGIHRADGTIAWIH